jgi:hypothetical protein
MSCSTDIKDTKTSSNRPVRLFSVVRLAPDPGPEPASKFVPRLCKVCGKPIAPYAKKYCSIKCQKADPEYRNAIAKTVKKLWENGTMRRLCRMTDERRKHISEGVKRSLRQSLAKHAKVVQETLTSFEEQGLRCIPLCEALSGSNLGPIPDAILIDFDRRKVYALEVETGTRSPTLAFDKYRAGHKFDDIILVIKARSYEDIKRWSKYIKGGDQNDR